MAEERVIFSEEPSQVKINIQDPNKPKAGKVIKKEQKKSFLDKLIGAFFGPDVNSQNIGQHFVDDYAVPTAKRMINNGIQTGLKRTGDAAQMMLFGKVINSSSGPVDYSSYSAQNSVPMGGYRVMEQVDVFAFTDKRKAEECLAYLCGRIKTYGSAGVLDYWEWINDNLKTDIPLDYNMANRGWKDLSNVRILTDPNGFIIDFPRPISLQR